MKTSKRVLSVFMAVLIVIMSISVGFSAFAAEDSYQVLADALKSDGVKNAVWSQRVQSGSDKDGYTLFTVTMNDSTGDIEKAAEAFWNVASEVAKGHMASGQKNDYNTLKGVRDEILEKLQNVYGVAGGDLSVAVSALNAFTAGQEGDEDDSGWLGTKVPNNRDYRFVVVRGNIGDLLLKYKTVKDIPNEIFTSVTYNWYHDAQTLKDSWGKWERNLFLSDKDNRTNRSEGGANTEVPAVIKAFDAFFSEHLDDDLNSMGAEELAALCDGIQAQIDAMAAVKLWGNDEVMNHFFVKDDIQNFKYAAETARDIAYAVEYASQIKEAVDSNDPASMEHEALTALYAKLTELRSKLLGCTADAQKVGLETAGITMDEINAYIASVNEEIEVDNLEGYKSAVDEAIASVPDLTAAADDALISANAVVRQQWVLISACTKGAVERVFTDGTAYVTDFIHDTQVEIDARALDGDVAGFGEYFAPKMTTDLTTLSTATLLTWRIDDKAKFEELKKYEQEAVDRVYGEGYYDSVKAYIASIDSTLQARVESQIDEASKNYNEYGKITILNYRAVKNAIGCVETDIIDVIGLTPEYQAKYDAFAAMLEEYNEFVASKGVSGWFESPEIDYPSRAPMAGDMARTADNAYEVTPEKLDTVINSIDGLMGNEELAELLGLDSVISELIKGAINDNLYTDAMVNTLVSAVYGAIVDALNNLDLGSIGKLLDIVGGIDGLLEDLGVAVYPDKVAKSMHAELYPEATAAMQAAGDNWNNYNMNVTWHVTDKESFVQAVSYGLCGLQNILWPVFTNQTFSEKAALIADVTIPGVGLYNTTILPLLELLGCENIMPSSQYNNGRWSQDLLPPILNPLLDWVENLADQPVSYVLELLPKLAYLMEFDTITENIKSINIHVKVKASIFWEGDVLKEALGTNNLYDILTSMIPELDFAMFSDINKLIPFVLSLAAPDSNLVLPTINQAFLASLGTLSQGTSGRLSGTRVVYTTDKSAALLAVLRYVLPMLGDQDFMDSLLAMIGKITGSEIALGDDVMNILKGMGANPDGVICAVTELFVPQKYSAKELNYTHNSEEQIGKPINTVTYSEEWTKEQAQFIADNTTDFVNDMMKILGGSDMPTLSELIRGYIADEFYTNETINGIILMVKEQLDGIGIELDSVLGLAGIDLSSWDNVTENTDWGVIPGDTATFKAALKEAFSPFAPIMATLMSGEADLTILDAVTMKSYPGYQNGIIPILENIGCDDEDIMSAAEYAELAASGNYDKMISAIIDPILNLVDEIYADPINKIMDILPNAFYFINCGNLQICVENALQSVFVMLDTVRPIYNLSFELNLNVQQILVDLAADIEVNGQKLNLKIPFLSDLSMLAVGNVTEYQSKSGKTAYRLTGADRADLVTVLMRNVVELVFYEDNLDAVINLVDSYVGMSDVNKENLKKILYAFAETYHENNGVDKIMNAVYVIYKTMYETSDGTVTVVGDFNERWSAVFDSLYNSGNPVLVEIAKAADEVLDFLSFGLINGDGIGTSGLIDFFDRFTAFFQGRVTSVSISQTSASLREGESFTLSLSFKPVTVKNKNAVWTTSDANVAIVENGVVKAVGPGDAEIKATTEDGGFTVSCVVRVRADKTVLMEALKRAQEAPADGALLSDDYINALATAHYVADKELASQAEVNESAEALIKALNALELGGKVENVTITQNGIPVGDVIYQKVPWTKKWSSTPVSLGLSINEDAAVKSISWEYANWSVSDQEAEIEPADDNMSAVIRATDGVGARSAWIQVTVEDVYGNRVTSDPVKIRFYNWDWQK